MGVQSGSARAGATISPQRAGVHMPDQFMGSGSMRSADILQEIGVCM